MKESVRKVADTRASLTRILGPLGLPLLGKPEWTDVNFGSSYTVNYFLIGRNILFITASGRASLNDIEQITAFGNGLLRSVMPEPLPYVRIEDWSQLQAPERGARNLYVQYLKQSRNLIGQVFVRLPASFRIAVRIARLTRTFHFSVAITGDYEAAVRKALSLLDGAQKGKALQPGPVASLGPNVVTSTRWQMQAEDYSLRYEVMDGWILHAVTTGKLRAELVEPSFRLQEQALEESGLAGKPYFLVLGLSHSKGMTPQARKPYDSSTRAFYVKYPFNALVFYGLNPFLRAAVNMYKPFVNFPVRIAQDLQGALALAAGATSKGLPRSPLARSWASAKKGRDAQRTQGYVLELLQFLEQLDWEHESVERALPDPSHPFLPVFEAIRLVKWEFDDLLSEQASAREELSKALVAAQAANRAKDAFLANMSHELRTPLHHIMGFTQLVLEEAGDRLDKSHREELGDVLKSSAHLLSLIEEVLDFSRVASGRLELMEDDVDLGALLTDSLKVVEDSARKSAVQVRLVLGDIPARVRADPRKLTQVLYNLLSNAVKFTPQGGKVILDARRAEPFYILVSVSDTGIGLDGEDLERVFLPFERIPGTQSAKHSGTGLGLSLARKYVELHGGRIWAESPGKDRGSVFHFTIPLAESRNKEKGSKEQ